MSNSTNVKVLIGSPSTMPRLAARKYTFFSWTILSLMTVLSSFSGSCGQFLSNSGFVRGIKFIANLVFTNVIQKDCRYERCCSFGSLSCLF